MPECDCVGCHSYRQIVFYKTCSLLTHSSLLFLIFLFSSHLFLPLIFFLLFLFSFLFLSSILFFFSFSSSVFFSVPSLPFFFSLIGHIRNSTIRTREGKYLHYNENRIIKTIPRQLCRRKRSSENITTK
jgi:uncharacterized membrane protein